MVFGFKKLKQTAVRTKKSLEVLNAVAQEWTESPDGEEFFARYFDHVGYCLSSWEKGIFATTDAPEKIAEYSELLAETVRSAGRNWEPPLADVVLLVPAYRHLPDPRR